MLTSPSSSVSTDSATWSWRGFNIAYQTQGTEGSAIVLVHGFGASFYHWRKNLPELAQVGRVYAIDLIGFGKSAKPKPLEEVDYTFETWGDQIADFCREVVGEPAHLVGNSIGSVVIMQTAVSHPEWVRSLCFVGCSLRLLHDKLREGQPWFKRIGTPIVQSLLKQEWVGNLFFKQLATPNTVRKVLLQAYGRKEAVTDELVNLLLGAASDRGATAVFVAFTGYSQGPLPQDLLPHLPCPAIFLWGAKDPWEPIGLGQKLADYPQVKKFIPLEGIGHCPQDEAPEVVNPIVIDWVRLESDRTAQTGSNTI
jgi:pimeloyl-ACP methyl ester carboxylesterase